MLLNPERFSLLVCPETKQPLAPISLEKAQCKIGSELVRREGIKAAIPPLVFLREDLQGAYPMVDGIPVLLLPEMLMPSDKMRSFNLKSPQYAEAYEEMSFYNRVATEEAAKIENTDAYKRLKPILSAPENKRLTFPHPRSLWIDAVYDCASQWDAYNYIAPVKDKRVLQLGGKGIHAVKFLIAGAREAWVVSPMLGEINYAIALAKAAGVEDRLRYAVCVAEELGLASESFDAIYSGGCLHHMVTSIALPEAARILKQGGTFSAVDPWRAPLYSFGTRLLGKREVGVYCRPLTSTRVAPLYESFSEARQIQHGTITRYPLLALNKFGINSNLATSWWLNKVDDMFSSLIPGMRNAGSSVVLLGTK